MHYTDFVMDNGEPERALLIIVKSVLIARKLGSREQFKLLTNVHLKVKIGLTLLSIRLVRKMQRR